jgi:hypothetical protein
MASLSLSLTVHGTIEWMGNQKHKHWILPVNGLQTDDPGTLKHTTIDQLDAYELMPQDTSLKTMMCTKRIYRVM